MDFQHPNYECTEFFFALSHTCGNVFECWDKFLTYFHSHPLALVTSR